MNKIVFGLYCFFTRLTCRITTYWVIAKVNVKFYFQAFLLLIGWPRRKPVEDCGFTLEELQDFIEAYEKCPKEPLPISFFKEVDE